MLGVTRRNAYVVLRDGDHVYLAEPVDEIRCVRSSPGPDIVIELKPDRGPLGDELPPDLDPSPCVDNRAALTMYRRAHAVLRSFGVTSPKVSCST